MKQFIVMAGVLPILLIFMLQVTCDQRNTALVGRIQDLVYAAKENAKQEGRFSAEIKGKLQEDLGKVLGLPPEEIKVEGDEEIKYRYSKGNDRLIHYRVEVPMKNVMAGGGFLRISEKENGYDYVIDSYTASEKL